MKWYTIKNIIGWVVCLGLLVSAASAQEKPNIIIFYVDDLGWQDVQLNDVDDPCPYETPNIVELAEGGMNFTQAYSAAPTCSPSRAGIMTGQHPAKINITHVSLGSTDNAKDDFPLAEPYLDRHLNTDILTLADALKQNSYRTGHVGKWHVGLTSASYGFDFVDQTRGIHRSLADRTKDFATADDPQYPLSAEKYPPYSEKKPMGISYPYDQLTESAIQFMTENKDEPFFLNMCHWMVHWPVCTRNGELLEYYCDKMGHPFPPPVGDMTLPGQQNPYFAAMVTSVDWSLGRVMDYLKETDDPRSPGKKLIETTYIFFTSDNGGAEKRGPELISDNYPLKYGKQHTEEGGVRVTTIISGEGIPEASQFDGMLSQLDFFPTILKLTNTEIAQEDQKNLFGLDISPVLFEQSQKIVDTGGVERLNLFWHFPHNQGSMKSSIREGDFKLYKQYTTGEFELYQLYENGIRKDLEEANNLANNPDYESVVSRLSTKLESHLQENHANGPYLNPSYNGNTIDPVAIVSSSYTLADRRAHLSLKNAPVKEAYVLYLDGDHPDVQYRVKFPAEISADGYAVSAHIPKNVPSYRFILIDSSNFQVYSGIKSALQDDIPYEVTFRVMDFETDSLLQNISVFVDQEEIKTNEHGEALYILNNGNYNYRISHPDYADLESSLEVTKDTAVHISLTQRAKTVVFSIYSEDSGNPLSNISVLIGGDEVATGLNGAAIFFLTKGLHEYTISHPDYFKSSASLELANDTTIEISLVANKANIKFRAYSEDKPVYNVVFELNGDSRSTNQTGVAFFDDLIRFEEYKWSASKEGYEDIGGTVSLDGDTIVNINMAHGTNNETSGLNSLNLYPNPGHSNIFIESDEKIERVDICDLRGALLYTKELKGSEIAIDLSGYHNGIYIARIYQEGLRTVSLKVVKSN